MKGSPHTRPIYMLQLFITGASPNSINAINNVRAICEAYLPDQYSLDIIDVYQKPWIAASEQLTALPALFKLSPLPVQKMIGNMSDTQKVLKGLHLGNV
ncbi:MAG TPA: circadian clock KaiB family protein [Puia sp.]|nr:circadian clock KaiB family protein [Puia sp.]